MSSSTGPIQHQMEQLRRDVDMLGRKEGFVRKQVFSVSRISGNGHTPEKTTLYSLQMAVVRCSNMEMKNCLRIFLSFVTSVLFPQHVDSTQFICFHNEDHNHCTLRQSIRNA